MSRRRTDQPDITLGKVTIATPASARKDVVMTPNKKLKIADVEYADNVDAYYRLTISLENIVPASGKTITEDDKNKVGSMFYAQNEYGVFTLGNNTKISNKQILIPSTLDSNIQGATATILVKAEAINKEGVTVDTSSLQNQYADYDSRPIYYQSLEAFKTTGHEVEDPYATPAPTLDKLTFTGLDASGAITTNESDIVAYQVSKVSPEVTKGDIVIPAEYNGKPVTVLGEFGGNWLMDSIICKEITSIYIPHSVKNISEFSLLYVSTYSLTRIVVDPNNTVYDSRNNCNAIIETASNSLIYGCVNSIISDTVINIGRSAFAYCQKLTQITIPNSVTNIAVNAFIGCSSLETIEIPSTVTAINSHAFTDCSKLSNLVLSERLTSIGGHAFRSCVSLASVNIPSSVTSIGDSAFVACSNLMNIYLNGNLDSEYNFATTEGYHWEYSVNADGTNGVTVTSMQAAGYYNLVPTPTLEKLTFTGLDAADQYTETESEIVAYLASKVSPEVTIGDVVIPAKYKGKLVTEIGSFGGPYPGADMDVCRNMTSIYIPSSVTKMSTYSFNQCSGLTKIVVDANNPVYDSRDNCNCIIETATNNLIVGCVNSVIPNGITKLETYAFYGCSGLTSINIPSSVTSLSQSTFSSTSVTSIVVANDNPVYDSRENCNCIIETATNKIILGCVNSTIPTSVTTIGDGAFSGAGFASIIVPDSVTSIASGAFSYCKNLKNVKLSKNITIINVATFTGCISLTNITIPNGVTWIDNIAFSSCTNLISIEIPSTVTKLDGYAFGNCPNFNQIHLTGDLTGNLTLPVTDGYHWVFNQSADSVEGETVTEMKLAGYYHRVANV